MRKYFAWPAFVLMIVFAVGVVAASAQTAPPAGQAQQDKDKDKVAADPVSGDWDGLVETPDQNMPFTLKLTLDKDKITGEVGSTQGAGPITAGTWDAKESKVVVSFTYVDGAAITMTGTLKDDQMTGSLSYGGQMVMNWVAKKKAK